MAIAELLHYAATGVTGLVAVVHLYFMYLEMVVWDTPKGRVIFDMTPEFSAASKALAANQGLYNGFLAAGLIWGIWLGPDGFSIRAFFLICVVAAGLFGWLTLAPKTGRKILRFQALPAVAALILEVATLFAA